MPNHNLEPYFLDADGWFAPLSEPILKAGGKKSTRKLSAGKKVRKLSAGKKVRKLSAGQMRKLSVGRRKVLAKLSTKLSAGKRKLSAGKRTAGKAKKLLAGNAKKSFKKKLSGGRMNELHSARQRTAAQGFDSLMKKLSKRWI